MVIIDTAHFFTPNADLPAVIVPDWVWEINNNAKSKLHIAFL